MRDGIKVCQEDADAANFRPYAGGGAPAMPVTLLLSPFAIVGLPYRTMRSNYITDQTITLDQPVPFSHAQPRRFGLDRRYCG